MKATAYFGSVLMQPYHQCSAAASLSLSEVVWQFEKQIILLVCHCFHSWKEVCECMCVYAGMEGVLSLRQRGALTSLMLN